jgi:ribosomal protein L32
VFFLVGTISEMIVRFMNVVADALYQLERVYVTSFIRNSPQLEWIPVMIESEYQQTPPVQQKKEFDLNEIFDGFLWGVPTCRRSVEKRWARKYGLPNWHNKLILPIKNLKVCLTCGHHHEHNRLCCKYLSSVNWL